MSQEAYKVVSLFSGAGGFDWGFHLAGFETSLACELLEEPASTFARNFKLEIEEAPASPRVNGRRFVVQGDIRKVTFENIKFEPDVLIGGPPCQDFSTVQASTRKGIKGKRGKLYLEFIRAVIQLKPKFFVFENVPGLTSANGGKVYNIIRQDLKDLSNPERLREICDEMDNLDASTLGVLEGYDLLFDEIIDAPDLGVPQTRRRLIIVGIRRDLFDQFHVLRQYQIQDAFANMLHGKNTLFPIFPLTTLEVFEGRPLPELEGKYCEIINAYRGLANSGIPAAVEWYAGKWQSQYTSNLVKDYFAVNDIPDTPHRRMQFEEAMDQHETLLSELGWRGRPVAEVNPGDETNDPPNTTPSVQARMSMIPPDENYAFVDGTEWAVTGKGISFIYRRSAPLKPAWTVVAYGGGGTHGYHYERNRAQLTLRERARIQTFTDDFVFNGPGVRAQIGEAVPPLMGKRIAEAIRQILETL